MRIAQSKNNRQVFLLLTLLILMVTVSSCHTTTEHKTYSLSGFVVSETREGIGNAAVLLYNPLAYDEDVVTMLSQFQAHGAELNQNRIFDHRMHTPVTISETAADGSFSLQGLKKGKYHIVVYKEGIGFEYVIDHSVDDNQTDFSIELKSITILPSVIENAFTLEDDRIYMCQNNLLVQPSGSLICGQNSTILVNEGGELDIYGALNISETSSLNITSSDMIYSHSNAQQDVGFFNQISLYNTTGIMFRNASISEAIYGVRIIDSPGAGLQNCYIESKYQAITGIRSNDLNIENCTITKSEEMSSRGAIFIENSENPLINKCHIYNNLEGVAFVASPNSQVRNSYFSNNSDVDLIFSRQYTGSAEHCTFINSYRAIWNYQGDIQIDYCDIKAEIGIHSYHLNARFTANFNNLDCVQYGIYSKSQFFGAELVYMNALRNYWFTTNVEEIETLIFDRNDESPTDENYPLYKSIVQFQPFSYTPNTAGVYNE